MTESEARERLYYMKNKVDVALMNSKYEKGHWLYDDVKGAADALKMAIKALENQEKIKKFVSDYDGAIIISDNMGVISGQILINELKQILRSGEE